MLAEVGVGFDPVRYVGELARSLHNSDSKLRELAVFKFFADESGIHKESKIFVLAGYLAPEELWSEFSAEWHRVLNEHGIGVFHATDCNANEGEFKQFEDKRTERNIFVAELLETLSSRSQIKPFYAGVVVEDYEQIIRPVMRPDDEPPYYVCMKWVLAEVAFFMDHMHVPSSEIVACVFDRQKKFSEKALTMFDEMVEDETWERRERFDSIAFGSKRRFIPLQAADALAFDVYHEFNRRCFQPNKSPRPSFPVLTANEHPDLQFCGQLWDRPFMERLINWPGLFIDKRKKR